MFIKTGLIAHLDRLNSGQHFALRPVGGKPVGTTVRTINSGWYSSEVTVYLKRGLAK